MYVFVSALQKQLCQPESQCPLLDKQDTDCVLYRNLDAIGNVMETVSLEVALVY